MAHGLTDPLTMLSFSSMPIEELCEHHRSMVAALRDADHWHRLITSRLDLAVASVADLDDLTLPPNALCYSFHAVPPRGLRELVGMAHSTLRLHESTLLTQLQTALGELDSYMETLRAVTGEAAIVIAARVGTVRVDA